MVSRYLMYVQGTQINMNTNNDKQQTSLHFAWSKIFEFLMKQVLIHHPFKTNKNVQNKQSTMPLYVCIKVKL